MKRWEGVDKAIKEWITKMEALVKMWEDQAGSNSTVKQCFLMSPFPSNCRQGHERHFRPFCQRHEAGRSGSPLEFPQGDVHPETENDGQYEPTYSSVIVRFHQNWPCRVKMSWIEGMNARKVLKEAITQMYVRRQI